ncbi:MAG: hypothetical protein KDD34_04560 [Bdellovibrionales bacterium]|nr:hypothetical protein [Bdellovibrionales bacterium]
MSPLFQWVVSVLLVSVVPSVGVSEVLTRNSFQQSEVQLELGDSQALVKALDIPFTIHEGVTVDIQTAKQRKGVEIQGKLKKQTAIGEFGEEQNKDVLELVISTSSLAESFDNETVRVRLIGQQSGIVHYMETVRLSVLPVITIRLWENKDGSIGWSSPKEMSIGKHKKPVRVVFKLTQDASSEIRIHGQKGVIPHAGRDPKDFLEYAGDSYEVLVEDQSPSAVGYYREHYNESDSDMRVIHFNVE